MHNFSCKDLLGSMLTKQYHSSYSVSTAKNADNVKLINPVFENISVRPATLLKEKWLSIPHSGTMHHTPSVTSHYSPTYRRHPSSQ